ncbi:MAG: P-loop NTPase fold protein, partial [Thermoanaerobaculia bacterium]
MDGPNSPINTPPFSAERYNHSVPNEQDPLRLISNDRPLEHPEDDRLGYAPFARHLAKALTETLTLEGLVLGLYGDWGSGKSTLINFLIKDLEKIDEKERPILVRFNPWWYSGSSNLTSRFLLEFMYGLSGRTRVSDQVREAIAGLADALGDVGIGGITLGAGKAVAGLVRPNHSAESLREKVVRGLEELDRRILVIVDDVDRLHEQEILQLFLAIKAIGNFPRTNYVLAMDKRVVVDALGRSGFGNGEEFLEKIVQVPLDLPDVDRSDLEKLLVEQLDRIFSDLPKHKFDTARWSWLFTQGLRPLLKTPRQVVRLVNCLSIVYPVVRDEVNPVDLIGIEALRLFFHPAYQAVRRNPKKFLSGLIPAWSHSESERQEERRFHERWLNEIPESQREPASRLVTSLFPTTAAALSSFSPYSVEDSQARRELRICAPERFPVYFRLSVPAGELRAVEVAELVDDAREGRRFAEKLLRLSQDLNPDGTSRARAALESFGDLCEGPLPDEVVFGGLEGLFEVGDQLVLLRDRKTELFDLENDSRIERCVTLLGGKVGADRYG